MITCPRCGMRIDADDTDTHENSGECAAELDEQEMF